MNPANLKKNPENKNKQRNLQIPEWHVILVMRKHVLDFLTHLSITLYMKLLAEVHSKTHGDDEIN